MTRNAVASWSVCRLAIVLGLAGVLGIVETGSIRADESRQQSLPFPSAHKTAMSPSANYKARIKRIPDAYSGPAYSLIPYDSKPHTHRDMIKFERPSVFMATETKTAAGSRIP